MNLFEQLDIAKNWIEKANWIDVANDKYVVWIVWK